ncbi:hypothetical protein PP753_gp20 [Dinoroseobacter phage vB_DshP-R7L]|uniref:Uncharacterized protein n=1 Tax=Dinoroseobacter phage vB_DshP-R7L TaxID=2873349 RepID=A0AAE9BML9_9CAUD|nr:hypothetical protein PP753_gp20 [Dinoroseobacter phage vB_DshP-R7L]UAT28859.1 hypothetical protein R7L_gp20 [Dinoroseobacter phage vB_DshP-R7L]
MPINRKNFLFRKHAYAFEKYLVPAHASRVEIHRDSEGYWINVWWHCGIIAPLTVQEEAQALGEQQC